MRNAWHRPGTSYVLNYLKIIKREEKWGEGRGEGGCKSCVVETRKKGQRTPAGE